MDICKVILFLCYLYPARFLRATIQRRMRVGITHHYHSSHSKLLFFFCAWAREASHKAIWKVGHACAHLNFSQNAGKEMHQQWGFRAHPPTQRSCFHNMRSKVMPQNSFHLSTRWPASTQLREYGTKPSHWCLGNQNWSRTPHPLHSGCYKI